MKQYHVYLDQKRLPLGEEELQYAETIATTLLYICKLSGIWDEPKYGKRIFTTKEIPQDVPQAGIYWIEVEMPTLDIKISENLHSRHQYIKPNLKNTPYF